MPADSFSNRITSIIEGAISKFASGFDADIKAVSREIELLIKDLVLKDGIIVPSVSNLKILNQVDEKILTALSKSGYDSRIEQFAKNYSSIWNSNNKYFEGLKEAFVPNDALFNAIKARAIESLRESLMGAGLQTTLIEPIKNIIEANIVSGADFFDMKKQVSEFVKGGKLESYAGQITRDAINQFNANYHEQVSSELGLDWFLYRGGRVRDTRPFCAQRFGKYYHRSEVESWASLSWAGKIPGTTKSTIYTYRGGYNCMHQIVAVATDVVPKADLARIAK